MYEYSAKITRVVDGDTVDCTIDLGFGVMIKERVRLYGIDAPESRTRDLEEKERGIAATNWLAEKVLAETVTLKSEAFNRGKYGRVIGTIYLDGVNINEQLVSEGHAEHYHID